jgi:hypothetical protein
MGLCYFFGAASGGNLGCLMNQLQQADFFFDVVAAS